VATNYCDHRTLWFPSVQCWSRARNDKLDRRPQRRTQINCRIHALLQDTRNERDYALVHKRLRLRLSIRLRNCNLVRVKHGSDIAEGLSRSERLPWTCV
jgi:hypothetical protein